MLQKLSVNLYSAQIARMDNGQVYASLFAGQKVEDEKSQNAKGLEIMKISCNEDVYDAISLKSTPAQYELTINLKRGAGGKMSQHCTSATSVNAPRSTSAGSK